MRFLLIIIISLTQLDLIGQGFAELYGNVSDVKGKKLVGAHISIEDENAFVAGVTF